MTRSLDRLTLTAPIGSALWRGALAGWAGGLVFAMAMLRLGGMLPTIAGLAGSDATGAGLAVHAVASVLIGVLFALLVGARRSGPGELIFWGLAYGATWWLLGALTLLPLLRGDSVHWDLPAVQAAYPSLLGHLAYGAVAAAVLVCLGNAADVGRPTVGARSRGVIAGALAATWLLVALDWAGMSAAAGVTGPGVMRWMLALGLGGLAGLTYAVLYPRPRGAIGPGLVRGLSFGFLAWVALPMTLVPVLAGSQLPWGLEAARLRAPALPATLLAGVLFVALYRLFTGLVGVALADDPRELADEGVGTRALRGLARGTAAGLVGGALFTVVVVQVGDLGRIAGLVGGASTGVGLTVHLFISVVLGASYGVAFRKEGSDGEAALGWGLSYGLLWWLLGGLTLLPVLLGQPPAWSASAIAAAFPSLIGHLAYGAGLGLTLAWLERRSNPWWTATTPARARRAQLGHARSAATGPGLWTVSSVVVLSILTLTAGG
ncbi:MAG: hypothetical protein M3Z02_02500 [Actinomycetota bacterium]|nr:hypothetical protein [Actinomycetota bacterium]